MSKDRALTGAAGEHYVAFRLYAMGYAVGLTTRGTRNVDMVVANPDTGKSITIDTKTMQKAFERSGSDYWWKWRMGVRAFEKPIHDDFFYVLVDLKGDPAKTPDLFIVPSKELHGLLEPHPEGVDPTSGKLTDVWCVIYGKDALKYQDKWDIINKAL
jgi:hypothetical protein